MKTILVVDDEPQIVRLVRDYLERAGFGVHTAGSGKPALALMRAEKPDMVILDLGLPDLDGLDVTREFRKISNAPIIMLTARSEETDKLVGLELGADDYITKPFSPRELVLRVKKILQRGQGSDQEQDRLKFGDLMIDGPRHLVTWRGKKVDLTATEFKLLMLLAQRRGRVQSRDQLLRDVWDYQSAIDTRTVDTHMRRLREKLGAASKFLDTVRGVGYRFVEE
jgi:two-component system phosphate regulon response regulator PhoB